MSDYDKMMAFGSWLTTRKLTTASELVAVSLNTKLPPSALRIKAGHLEAINHVLEAFTDLYNGDLNKFEVEYLGKVPEEEDDKESTTTNGPSESA